MLSQKSRDNRKLGASTAPVLNGTAPKKWEINTPLKLYNQMKSGRETFETWAMAEGTAAEEGIRQHFERQLGTIFFGDVPIAHPEHGFLTATLDGLDPDKTAILEIKKTNKEVHALAKNGQISPIYYPQVQQQLEIAHALYGTKKGYFGTCHSEWIEEGGQKIELRDYALVEFTLDERFVPQIISRASDFWECLQTNTPPAAQEWDFKPASDEYLKKEKEWARLQKRLEKLKAPKKWQEKLKALEEQEETVRQELIALSKGDNTEGMLTKVLKIVQKGNVDYAKIPELSGVNLDAYRKSAITKYRVSAI